MNQKPKIKIQRDGFNRAKSPSMDGIVRPTPVISQNPLETSKVFDTNKRGFLRLAGLTGFGLLMAMFFPKKADALILGSSPTTGVVGVKDAANARINPATEETLAGIKIASDKLQFDVSNNLKVVTSGGSAETQLVDSSGDAIPTTQNGLKVDAADSLFYLRRIAKLLESQATVDSANRQRVSIDASTNTQTVSGTVTVTSTAITTLAGQNQQMFQDVARNTIANSIRNKITFS